MVSRGVALRGTNSHCESAILSDIQEVRLLRGVTETGVKLSMFEHSSENDQSKKQISPAFTTAQIRHKHLRK